MKKCVRLSLIKEFTIVLVIVIFVSAPVFSYEVIERFRLGAVVESLTYINSGPLEGKIALVDGSSVYLHDPALGNYEKLFSVLSADFVMEPRGIAYLSQGPFANSFLLVDWGVIYLPSTFYLFTTTGSLVGPVVAQDFAWWGAEGLTQITSGPYEGMIAMITYPSPAPEYPHIIIFGLQQNGTEIQAWFEQDISLDFLPPPNSALGITYLPSDFPDPSYHDMFVVSDHASESVYVIDYNGDYIAVFPGIARCEGLAYFSSGTYQGKFLLADLSLLNAEIFSLDGSDPVPSSIPRVGLGFGPEYGYFRAPLSWLKEREQLFIIEWEGFYYDIPVSLISRWSAGVWHRDERLRIPHFRQIRNITELTADGTYKLFGIISPAGEPYRYGVASLDAAFNLIGEITPLPDDYEGFSFGTLVYVAGDTPDPDRFVVPSGTNIYSFDYSFQPGEMIADLSEVMMNLVSNVCYDSAARRFYVTERSRNVQEWDDILRVFDADWNIIDSFVIEGRVGGVTKITSGELRGNIALSNSGDSKVIILNVEYDLAAALIGRLIGDIQTTGLKKGLAKSLVSKLEDALDSIEKKHARPAVNQLEEFIDAVRAQSGKGIPAATAEGWLALAQNVISGLQELL